MPSSRTLLLIAATTAATCALLDVGWHLALDRPRLDGARFWLWPLAATASLALLAYPLLLLGARFLSAPIGRVHAERLAAAVAVFELAALLLVSAGGVLAPDLTLADPARLAAALMLAAAAGWGAYRAARSLEESGEAGSSRWISRLAFALPLLLALFFCALLFRLHVPKRATAPPVRAEERARPVSRVLLLTVDTLRADHLGSYGAEGSPTPNIDRLAADGVLFERALSPASWTLPAVASIMTGVSPMLHKTSSHEHGLPEALPTLAEHLRRAGYRTAALGKNVHLQRHSRLSRGFQQYRFFPKSTIRAALGTRLLRRLWPAALRSDASTTELTDLTLRWLDRHGEEDFFFWLHYFDPHIPYAPPPGYLEAEDRVEPGTASFSAAASVRDGTLVPGSRQKRWIHSLYRAEIRYLDEQIGRLLDGLEHRGLYEETLIVLTSDHGEEFWEHGGFEHGHSLYDEVLRVPLIVKPPAGTTAPERVGGAVSTQSLLATVLDLCGLSEPGGELPPSASLRPLWDPAAGQAADRRQPVLSTGVRYAENQIALSFDRYKFIRRPSDGHEELYDLVSDPGEERSIAAERPDLVERARRMLEQHELASSLWAERLGIAEGQSAEALDSQTLEELRSLGYLN